MRSCLEETDEIGQFDVSLQEFSTQNGHIHRVRQGLEKVLEEWFMSIVISVLVLRNTTIYLSLLCIVHPLPLLLSEQVMSRNESFLEMKVAIYVYLFIQISLFFLSLN